MHLIRCWPHYHTKRNATVAFYSVTKFSAVAAVRRSLGARPPAGAAAARMRQRLEPMRNANAPAATQRLSPWIDRLGAKVRIAATIAGAPPAYLAHAGAVSW